MWRTVLVVAIVMTSGCGTESHGSAAPTVRPTPEPFEQRFEPPYDPQVPNSDLVSIQDAKLDPDRRTLTISFIGGPGFSPDDPCSTDYEPWVQPNVGLRSSRMKPT